MMPILGETSPDRDMIRPLPPVLFVIPEKDKNLEQAACLERC